MHAINLWENGWLKKLDDIYIIRMTMPFPLKENNCFLAESDDGWVILDTGVNLQSNKDLLKLAMDEIGITFKQLSAVYLTHYHHDHTGLTGWLQQQKADLPVYLPQPDLLTWERYINTDTYLERAWPACKLAGWPRGYTEELAENINQINVMLEPYARFSPLFAGEQLSLGGHQYKAIAVPGHSAGHFVFHSPETNFLFSGDNVVDHTILHLTDWPHGNLENPCDTHLAALQNLKNLNINTVLPGHGSVFYNLFDKIDLINRHHQKRKAAVFDALQAPMNAWELTERLFPPHEFIHIRRLVMAETLAYLDSLVNEGLVEQDLVQNVYIYRPKGLRTESSRPVIFKHN